MEKKDYVLLPGIIARLNDQTVGWRLLHGWQASQSDKLYSNSPYAYVAFHTAEGLSAAKRTQAAADPRAEFNRQFQRLNSQTERCRRRVVREWGEVLEKHPDISRKIVGWLKLDQEHPPTPSSTRRGLRSQSSVEHLPGAVPHVQSRQGSVDGPQAKLEQTSPEPPALNVQQEPAEDFATQPSQASEEDVQETTPEQQLLEEERMAAERELNNSSHAEPTQGLDGTVENEASVQLYEDSGGQQTQHPESPQQVLTRARRDLEERRAIEAAVRLGGPISAPIFERRLAAMAPQGDYEGDSSRLGLVSHTVEKPSANTNATPASACWSDNRFPEISPKVVVQQHVPSGTCCISGASAAEVRALLPPHLYKVLHREFLSSDDKIIVPSVELVIFGAERETEECRLYVRVDRSAVSGLMKTLVDVNIEDRDGCHYVCLPHTQSRIILAPSMLISEPRRGQLAAAFGEELADAVLEGPIAAAEYERNAATQVTEAVGFTTQPDAWTGGELVLSIGTAKGHELCERLFGRFADITPFLERVSEHSS